MFMAAAAAVVVVVVSVMVAAPAAVVIIVIIVIIVVMMVTVIVPAAAGIVVIIVMMHTGRLCFVRLSDIRPALFRFVFFVFVVAHGINLRTIQSLLKCSTVKDRMLEKPFVVNVYSSGLARFRCEAISLFVQVLQPNVDDRAHMRVRERIIDVLPVAPELDKVRKAQALQLM